MSYIEIEKRGFDLKKLATVDQIMCDNNIN